MTTIDIEHLRQSFSYNPETGVLTRTSTGRETKGLDAHGYVQLGYRKKMYKAHRIIWALVHGGFPDGQIDHINGVRSDNRLANLRVVTHQENAHNQRKPNRRSRSGYVGVCWNNSANKWQAGIHVNGRSIYLGVFATPEAAHAAYLAAKRIHHPTAPH